MMMMMIRRCTNGVRRAKNVVVFAVVLSLLVALGYTTFVPEEITYQAPPPPELTVTTTTTTTTTTIVDSITSVSPSTTPTTTSLAPSTTIPDSSIDAKISSPIIQTQPKETTSTTDVEVVYFGNQTIKIDPSKAVLLPSFGNYTYFIHDNPSSSPSSSKRKVMIMTLPRSGSTFCGGLFQNNPEFVYLFETTRDIADTFDSDQCSNEPKHSDAYDVMKDTFDCNLTSLIKACSKAEARHGDLPWAYQWGFKIIADHSSGNINSCIPSENETYEQKQKRSNMSVALKEIWMWSGKLNWLNQIVGGDLKTIWLVRDVRGWASSLLVSTTQGYDLYGSFGFIGQNLWDRFSGCSEDFTSDLLTDSQFKNIQALLIDKLATPHKRLAAWWTFDILYSRMMLRKYKSSYMMLTYEKLANEPMEMAEKIYEYIDLPLHPDVSDWIIHSTQGGSQNDRFGTSRNSKSMINIWQLRLPEEVIRDIEDIAEPVFKICSLSRMTRRLP
eukprot:TRINITY_DN2724_c4_g1_i1.p1 TRINITY_DN2724_c4_g1~~TRINITY_DN2724_c4_g1_i1.p1  ORF type:complete len:498 (-),score=138.71 TRINITY_DN2724_c4_g1_i1:114-1607(-)